VAKGKAATGIDQRPLIYAIGSLAEYLHSPVGALETIHNGEAPILQSRRRTQGTEVVGRIVAAVASRQAGVEKVVSGQLVGDSLRTGTGGDLILNSLQTADPGHFRSNPKAIVDDAPKVGRACAQLDAFRHVY